jgi:hypothetical protein
MNKKLHARKNNDYKGGTKNYMRGTNNDYKGGTKNYMRGTNKTTKEEQKITCAEQIVIIERTKI